MRRSTSICALAAIVLAAGCSSKLGSGPPSGVACPTLALSGPPLLAPVPGSTGVSPAIGELVVDGTNVAATALFDLIGPSGTIVAKVHAGPAPSPLPSPIATIGPNGEATPIGLSIPSLPPSTTIIVQEEPQSDGQCEIPYGTSGSFTTGS